jgi:hypothetical protein
MLATESLVELLDVELLDRLLRRSDAGMLTGLARYSGSRIGQRGARPTLLVLDTIVARVVSAPRRAQVWVWI